MPEKRTGENITPERRRDKATWQAERRQRLTKAANIAGYDTIDKLAIAIISGEAVITKVNQQ